MTACLSPGVDVLGELDELSRSSGESSSSSGRVGMTEGTEGRERANRKAEGLEAPLNLRSPCFKENSGQKSFFSCWS